MARTVTGVDVGLRTAKFLRGQWKGNTLKLTGFAATPVASKEIAEGWSAAEPGFKPVNARVGLTGRDVSIRYTRAPRVPDWQLKNLMRFEVEEIGEQAGAGVASDFNLLPPLPEIEGEDVVLLAMARESLLDGHVAGLAKLGGTLDAFSPNAVALYNAWLRFGVVGDETVLLANIGHENVDIAIARGPDLLFARNLTGGSKLFEDALAQRLGVAPEKAAEIKERQVTLDLSERRFSDPNQEKASRAALGAAGQILSLLQSAVLFCKSQVKVTGLKLDRVLLCGGGAALAGLPKYLASGLSVPVELFDPWRVVDTSALSPAELTELEAHKLECVVVLGLAAMASDPEAWSIEILPAKLKRRREFLEGPVWLAVAGLLALGYLGFDAVRTRNRLADARTRARAVEQRPQEGEPGPPQDGGARGGERAAPEDGAAPLRGEGDGRAARADDRAAREVAAGRAVDHAALDGPARRPELRIPKGSERPAVSIAGRAREGTTALSTLRGAFIESLTKGLPPGTALRDRPSPTGARFTIDLTMFAPPEAPPPEAPPAEGDAPAESKKGEKTGS